MFYGYLSVLGIMLSVTFMVVVLVNFQKPNTKQISLVKILLILSLLIISVILQNWLLIFIWVFNLTLQIIIMPTSPSLTENSTKPVEGQTENVVFETFGTNCNACGAPNEYPVDGKAHYCTHCSTVLPKAS